jgi:membrane protein YqaA with SNARE-associated domain
MRLPDTLAVLLPDTERAVRHWIYQLGGIGFIPLGLLDASIVPIPGSMDALTIFLAARNREWWLYYAAMATIGSVIGGYVTYRLARKGGKEALSRRFPQRRLNTVYKAFERWGWGAVTVPAMLPPPVPMVPFLFAAGAMQYPVKKFLVALTLGRLARYTLLAFLAEQYGRRALSFMRQHGHPVLLAGSGVVALVVIVGLYFILGKRQTRSPAGS